MFPLGNMFLNMKIAVSYSLEVDTNVKGVLILSQLTCSSIYSQIVSPSCLFLFLFIFFIF